MFRKLSGSSLGNSPGGELLFRLCIVLTMLFGAMPVSAAISTCIEGAPEPVSRFAPSLRPTRTAQCPYGFDELFKRITKLIVHKNAVDSAETVEKTFGIPTMTTSIDDPHEAMYATVLSGIGGWKVQVAVTESAPPSFLGPGHHAPSPAIFRPGPRPKRLVSIADERVMIRFDLAVHTPRSWGDPRCVQSTPFNALPPSSPIFDALMKEGWEDISAEMAAMTTDGGASGKVFKSGNKTVSIDTPECGWPIVLMQNPVKH
jgi:hypothetical protein